MRTLTLDCKFEYDARYFQSYAKRKPHIEELYTRYLRWADVLEGLGKTALDVGAAFGYLVELLRRHAYDAIGLDASRFAVVSSRSKYMICAGGEGPPFREESFDLITCFETIEHFMHPDDALACYYALLRENGVLLMTTPTPLGEKTHRFFLKRYPYYSDDSSIKPTEEIRDAHHPSLRKCEDWEHAIRSAGFRRVKRRHFILTPPFLGKYRVLPSPGFSAEHMIIRADKG